MIVNCVKQFTLTGLSVFFFPFFPFFFLPGFCFSAVFHCLLGFVSCCLSLFKYYIIQAFVLCRPSLFIVNCIKQFTITWHRVLGFVSCCLSLSIISSYRLMFHAVFHFLLLSLRVLFSSVFHFQIQISYRLVFNAVFHLWITL